MVFVGGERRSGSTAELGSGTGALGSALSAGASDCSSPGEEDLWTTGSDFGVSSDRRDVGEKSNA